MTKVMTEFVLVFNLKCKYCYVTSQVRMKFFTPRGDQFSIWMDGFFKNGILIAKKG